MDKGSRLISLLQNLEKLGGPRAGPKASLEDLQQVRYTTAKILQYVQSSEKVHRDLVIKNSQYLEVLLTTLEYSEDLCVEQNIVYIINELIGKTQNLDQHEEHDADDEFAHVEDGGKRLATLVSHGATHILLQTLVYEARELKEAEELLVLIHQVLAKLGPKDRKFCVKARLSQGLPVTLNLVRNVIPKAKLLQPVVHVLKLYAANAVNASYLGKNGAVTYLFKILSSCGRKHLTLVKYALDTLALLVKSKSNSARAVGQGGVAVLVNMFYDWHRADNKNRHVNLRKAMLSVLKHITNIKSGRKALMEVDGFRILYETCQESVDCRELESVIFMASVIMRKCFPKNRLPLDNLRSTLTCPLPNSDFHVVETGEGQGDICSVSSLFPHHIHRSGLGFKFRNVPADQAELSAVIDQLRAGDENGYESSVDNDDDISSDDDPETKVESEEEDADHKRDFPNRRTWDDLVQYQQFYPELFEFDALLEDEPGMPLLNPIVIPTAVPWDMGQADGKTTAGSPFHPSQSMKDPPNPNKHLSNSMNRHSFPNISDAYGCSTDETMSKSSYSLRSCRWSGGIVPDAGQCYDSSETGLNLFSDSGTFSAASNRKLFRDNSSEDGDLDAVTSTNAINLKTGSSIFSLDLSSKYNNAASRKEIAKKKQFGYSKPITSAKEKRMKQRNKGDDQFNHDSSLLSITPLISTKGRLHESDCSGEDDLSTGDDELHVDQPVIHPEVFAKIAYKTRSVGRFNKITYPDMYGSTTPLYKEPFHEKKFGVQRAKIFEDIDRFINPDHVIDYVVYDLDAIVNTAGPTYSGTFSNLTNGDQAWVSAKCDEVPEHLNFNSQFESGNLRKAIQIRKYEYDLILSPDVNTNHHHQWFYFEVSGMEAGVKYRFNIVNCEKLNSQFNFGMRPVMYSVAEALRGRPRWVRVGTEICYYKNHFLRSAQATGGVRGKSYFTTSFSVTFTHNNDVCYLAYHYPYTYSMLQAHLFKCENTYDSNQVYFKNQVFCHSLAGNPVNVLTITSHPQTYDNDGIMQLKNRPYIFLSGRVHPGESNASWVMKGTIDFLLSDRPLARQLRDLYIFKIVPMLNPDGVINGNHRCSLVAEDLNRRWLNPCPKLHPTIFHCKGLLQYLVLVNKAPLVYCDYHGHSRRKNVFMYGCSPSQSWMDEDLNNPAVSANKVEDVGYKTLPRVLQNIAPAFSFPNCSFVVEKSKESTARVVVWRQIGVVRSYTMESTFCGCDQGPNRGQHINTHELEEMGVRFCEGLVKVRSRHTRSYSCSFDGPSTSGTSGVDMAYSCGEISRHSEGKFSGLLGATAAEPHSVIGSLNLHSTSNSSITASESENSEKEDEEEEL